MTEDQEIVFDMFSSMFPQIYKDMTAILSEDLDSDSPTEEDL